MKGRPSLGMIAGSGRACQPEPLAVARDSAESVLALFPLWERVAALRNGVGVIVRMISHTRATSAFSRISFDIRTIHARLMNLVPFCSRSQLGSAVCSSGFGAIAEFRRPVDNQFTNRRVIA